MKTKIIKPHKKTKFPGNKSFSKKYYSPKELLALSLNQLENNNLDKALKYIFFALEEDCEKEFKAELLYWKGNIFQKSKSIGLAIENYNKAIALTQDLPLAFRSLGVCYCLSNKFLLAETCYLRAKVLDPENFRSPFYLGNLYVKFNFFEKAETEYLLAYEIGGKYKEKYEAVLNNLGICYEVQGSFNLANDYYFKAISKNANFAPAYYSRGQLLFKDKHFDEAEKCFKKYIKLNDKDPKGYFCLASIQFKLGNIEQGKQLLKKCSSLSKEYEERAKDFKLKVNREDEDKYLDRLELTVEDISDRECKD